MLKYNDNDKILAGESINTSTIWIRSVIDTEDVNSYFYSTDGITFQPYGGKYSLKWGSFRGDNIGIYNYNNLEEKGYVDIDWFHYRF
jgi:hypothetical protein